MTKLPIRFSASKVYSQTYLKAACPRSDALFLLLKRSTISSDELKYVGQMGFEIELIGDIKPVKQEIGTEKVQITPTGIYVKYEDEEDDEEYTDD